MQLQHNMAALSYNNDADAVSTAQQDKNTTTRSQVEVSMADIQSQLVLIRR